MRYKFSVKIVSLALLRVWEAEHKLKKQIVFARMKLYFRKKKEYSGWHLWFSAFEFKHAFSDFIM